MDEQENWERLVQGFRAGDQQIFQEFWNEYSPQLHKIAEKHLADKLRRRIGPEDVVQSACRTFFRRIQGGMLELSDSESLWRLLCAITLTKVREQARFHLRRKRGLDQEIQAASATDSSSEGFPFTAPGPSPAALAEFADQLQNLLASLDEEERQIVDLKLQEFTHEEVAQKLGLSERTVRRIFKRLQAKLARAFKADS